MNTRRDADDWFEFRPVRDDFAPSALDCSRFIEKPAGRHGFLRAEGERFVFEDGTPARFFGAQLHRAYDPETADYVCRRLVKQGINIVRWHGDIGINRRDGNSVFDYDHERWDALDRMFHRLGQEGVYIILDTDYYLRVKPGDKVPGLPEGGQTQFLTFFDPDVIRIKRQRMKDVFTHFSPYSGKRYCDDPVIALVEVCNEDSLFWYGIEGLAEPFRTELEELFKAWLRGRHGGEGALRKAWGAAALAPDEGLEAGRRVAVMGIHEFREEHLREHPERARRASDQMRFFLDLERKYFTETRDFLRAIGVKTPICGTNWQGGGFTTRVHMRGQAQLDYVDRHGYWDHPQGEGNLKWRIATCRFHNLPMVKAVIVEPDAHQELGVGNLVLHKAWERVLGKPMTVTEWNTCLPNEYSLEGTGLMAVYGMLQGWDAPMQFGYFSPDWSAKLGPGSFDLLANTPQLLQFPAVATMWYRRDVKEARLVGEALWGPHELFEPAGDRKPVPWPAAWVGKVGCRFVEKRRKAVARDISPYWDAGSLTACSVTGQLCWDASEGVVTVDTPRTQAVIGFLNAESQELSSVALASTTPFGAVYVTSLEDAKAILSARRLLVTAVGQARNTGMDYETTAEMDRHQQSPLWRLKDEGREPVLLRAVVGELRIRSRHARRLRAWTLDVNGKRRHEVPLEAAGGAVILRLEQRHEAFYYEAAVE
jgi:hypothetical protein